jgi:hypothetical protein
VGGRSEGPHDIRVLTEHETLDGEDVVPGFAMAVADAFA